MARPRQFTDAQILEHARACFLEHGPGVSTTVIAQRVGLSQGALFKRFGTKTELMKAALLPPEFPDCLELLEAGPDQSPLEDQLVHIGLAVGSFFSEVIPCITTLMASGVSKEECFRSFDVPPPIRTHMAVVAWFQRAAGAGLVPSDVNAVHAATAFLGTLHVRAFMQHVGAPGVDDPLESYVKSVARITSNGIREDR